MAPKGVPDHRNKMAKWFKEFPITLKNGTERIRTAHETGSQTKDPKEGLTVSGSATKISGFKIGQRKNSLVDSFTSSVLSGKNRKNSAVELSRTDVDSQKEDKVWTSLPVGRGHKSPKAESVFGEQSRPAKKSSPPAKSYIGRLIRVDKQEKGANFHCGTIPRGVKAEAKKSILCKTQSLIILEDYADPFDAHKTKDQREADWTEGNDGYMEPYDAQQMITEIRRRGSKDLLKGSESTESTGKTVEEHPALLQTYDVPYEGGGDDMQMTVLRPELDPRPASEYELPWEWRKEHIVRTLSAQYDSATRDEAPRPALTRQPQHPAVQPLQRQHVRQKSWTQKILRLSPLTLLPSNSETEACAVDPSIPLEKQSWYHGCVTRQEVESQLQSCREASFLVRNSESDNSKYSIALKTSQGCVHIIVAQTKESGYTLDQTSCVFASIPEVVHHYCTQCLPFNGAEHRTLRYPVPRFH